MAAFFDLTLDTTAPGGVSITLEGGASTTTTRDIDAALATTDGGGSPSGYQMKIYGDVDGSFDADVQPLEENSNWISFAATKAIRLSTGDGTKTVRVKIRDDVWNASSEQTDAITLDTAAPTVTITVAPSTTIVSKIATKDTMTFSWESDLDFTEYKVKVVPSSGSAHTAGTQIPTTGGSDNVADTGTFPDLTDIETTIKGADLEAAGAEGVNIVKVFAKTAAGNWSA